MDKKDKKNSFEELKEGTLKKFEGSMITAKEAALNYRFPPYRNRSIKEIRNYTKLLDQSGELLLLIVEKFLKHLPSPLEKKRGRSVWEVYLSGLRYFCRKYPQGFFRQVVLSPREWGDFPGKIDSFICKCSEGFTDIADLSKELEKYCRHHQNGLNIAKQYKEWQPDSVGLYASLKTWKGDDEFQVFENRLLKAQQQIIEIIIEGPIQLYLIIGQENFFIILKILTLKDLRDFYSDQDQEEPRDLKDLNESVYKTVENSEFLETFKELSKESLRICSDNFLEEEKRRRRQYPDEELRDRFIKCFEEGDVFFK